VESWPSASLMSAKTGVFGIAATSGWTLYSRTAGFADCTGAAIAPAARPLCETAQQRQSHPTAPDWYMLGAATCSGPGAARSGVRSMSRVS